MFFLTEGNKKILIHKEKFRFPFSATAHGDFEIFKKALLDFSNYPIPSTQIHPQDFPRMTQQNLPVMSSADQDLMRNWANTHGECVRQRTVRQETKYKASTLPLNIYQTAVHGENG